LGGRVRFGTNANCHLGCEFADFETQSGEFAAFFLLNKGWIPKDPELHVLKAVGTTYKPDPEIKENYRLKLAIFNKDPRKRKGNAIRSLYPNTGRELPTPAA
jgi:hypothetical protein